MRARHRTAEQVVDRLLRGLADDVPQRLLDAGDGAVEFERAAPLRVVVERDLQEMPDLERIAADEIAAELFDLRGDGAIAVVLAVGLAPADDPASVSTRTKTKFLRQPEWTGRHSTLAIFIGTRSQVCGCRGALRC